MQPRSYASSTVDSLSGGCNYFRRTRDTGDLTQRGRKKTKVVATVGPASEEETVLRRLLRGMNVARMNMGHGDYQITSDASLVRHVSEDLERPVAVLVASGS